jgi:hypothetical protein
VTLHRHRQEVPVKRFLALAVLAACSSTTPPPAQVTAAVVALPDESILQLAAHRAKLIGWLHDYRDAGSYPTDEAGRPISVFVDAHGVRCPMAELLHKSGRDDLVDAVAREANGVRLADVHEGPLHAWMLGSGLTMDEIAMVQGAMNVDFGWMQREEGAAQILAARAEVRGKLEASEIALRDNTSAALAAAAKRLPAHQQPANLAIAPVHGAVIPKAAIPKPVQLGELLPLRRGMIVAPPH